MVGQNGKGDYGQVYGWAEKARKESNRRDERENVAMERGRGTNQHLRPQDPQVSTFYYQCEGGFEVSIFLCRMRTARLSLQHPQARDDSLRGKTGGVREGKLKDREWT